MKKNTLLLITVSLIILSTIIVYFVTIADPNTEKPNETVDHPLPLISLDLEPNSPEIYITKGTTFTGNLTITSLTDKELEIPLGFILYVIRNSKGVELVPEENGFVYSSDPELIVLEAFGASFSEITVVLSGDVEVGEYQFRFETGNWEETHVGGTSLQVFVTSQE